jgi:hypothetical protein
LLQRVDWNDKKLSEVGGMVRRGGVANVLDTVPSE